MLMLHVHHFSSTITEKEGQKSLKTITQVLRQRQVDEALLVLVSVEKQDETSPENISKKAKEEIAKLVHHLNVSTVVPHPFAHLFGELSKPDVAVAVLKLTEEKLVQDGKVIRTPFGWFNTLELKSQRSPVIKGGKNYLLNLMEAFMWKQRLLSSMRLHMVKSDLGMP